MIIFNKSFAFFISKDIFTSSFIYLLYFLLITFSFYFIFLDLNFLISKPIVDWLTYIRTIIHILNIKLIICNAFFISITTQWTQISIIFIRSINNYRFYSMPSWFIGSYTFPVNCTPKVDTPIFPSCYQNIMDFCGIFFLCLR